MNDLIMATLTRDVLLTGPSCQTTLPEGRYVYVRVADLAADAEYVYIGQNCAVANIYVGRDTVSVEPRWRELSTSEYNHTPLSQHLVLNLRDMADEVLLDVMREGDAHAALVELYPGSNPTWFTFTAADVAYDRQLIDEQELDYITR